MKSAHGDAELVLRLYEMRRDHEMRKAREWFDTDFDPRSAQDVIEVVGSGFAPSAYFRMVLRDVERILDHAHDRGWTSPEDDLLAYGVSTGPVLLCKRLIDERACQPIVFHQGSSLNEGGSNRALLREQRETTCYCVKVAIRSACLSSRASSEC